MKQVRTHAYPRPEAGLWIDSHELDALMRNPAWHLRLFALLVLHSNFQTGHGRTGYGELINGLTPDQPERGPRLWAPTRSDIKRALSALEAARLVALDKLASEQLQVIIFHVAARDRRGVSREKQNPKLAPGVYLGEMGQFAPGTCTPLSVEKEIHPLPLVDNKLSTGDRGETLARLQRVRERVRGQARGGKSSAPKGA